MSKETNYSKQWHPKYASNFVLQSVSISIFLIFCILINIFFYESLKAEEEKLQLLFLKMYAEKVEGFILQDFQKALEPHYKAKDFSGIQNFATKTGNNKKLPHKAIYLSNNILHVKKGDKYLIVELSNIKKILDGLASNLFFYTIKINNEQVLTNTVSALVNSLSHNYSITEDIILDISIEHDKLSKPILFLNARVKVKFLQTLFLSIGLFFVGVVMILRFIKQEKELGLEKNHKNDILLFLDKDREFILKCYEYSKKSKSVMQNEVEGAYYNDYLPLSIIHDINKSQLIEININKIAHAIKDYFSSYKAYHQLDNVKLDVIHDNIKNIIVPFDNEVFYQIVISIIYNLMNFNKKSSDNRKIEIYFSKEQIIISSDGLKLNKEYAIKASETIFLDTANPYLLNFGQIFVLFNNINIRFDVDYTRNGTVITIILPYIKKTEHNSFARVVNLNKYRENKVR